jgi:hypothetical protein
VEIKGQLRNKQSLFMELSVARSNNSAQLWSKQPDLMEAAVIRAIMAVAKARAQAQL